MLSLTQKMQTNPTIYRLAQTKFTHKMLKTSHPSADQRYVFPLTVEKRHSPAMKGLKRNANVIRMSMSHWKVSCGVNVALSSLGKAIHPTNTVSLPLLLTDHIPTEKKLHTPTDQIFLSIHTLKHYFKPTQDVYT